MSTHIATDLRAQLVEDALDVWAPSYPRRVNRHQRWVNSHDETVSNLFTAEEQDGNSPFISTYAFPRGHSKDDNIPEVDTLFIDFDFEGGAYVSGSGNREAWRRDLSHLLVRVRRVAQHIHDSGKGGWRASLSGHKGVHLFLDFPPLDPDTSFSKVVNGLDDYATELVDYISCQTGIESLSDYVDVTSSDLGRLCRVPNTLHTGATSSFGERRFCVPITIAELSEITVDRYEELTSAPRPVPQERSPNAEVHDVLTQYVRNATEHNHVDTSGWSTTNWGRVDEYKELSNDDIELEDIKFLTSDRPCVWRFYQRDDKYQYGAQSHYMELFCIRELVEHRVPIGTMIEFLDSAPEFDEEYSRRRIKEVIARDYNRFSIETVLRNAREFCGYDYCALCQSVLDDNPKLQHHA